MKKKRKRIQIIVTSVVLVLIIGLVVSSGYKSDIGPCTEYRLDVKNLHLATTIDIYQSNKKLYTISGNLFKLVTDPLTMYDDGKKVAYASDSYRFIAQDSHSIIYNSTSTDMVGEVDFWGESYTIYDSNGKKIATVSVDQFNTHGKMIDTDGKLLADYTSILFANDFDVRIKDDCPIDDEIVLMIFASYYSDFKYDSQSSSNSNSNH